MPFIIESDSGNGWCIRQRCPELNAELSHKPVSYTHLTLPTTPYV